MGQLWTFPNQDVPIFQIKFFVWRKIIFFIIIIVGFVVVLVKVKNNL